MNKPRQAEQAELVEKNFSKMVALTRYARWDTEKKRRENWEETVDRSLGWLVNHISKKFNYSIDNKLYKKLRTAMINKDVFPAMRLMHYAGPAMDRNKARLFNCSALTFDSVRAFDETIYLLMCGCGVGARITPEKVKHLPEVPFELQEDKNIVVVVQDSLEGWARAIKLLISNLYAGVVPVLDTSKIRAKGERLQTAGGFAPGPNPLENIWYHIVDIFKQANGRKLRTQEVYSIFTKLAEGVVSGGSRRSALITIFSPNDRSILTAKTADWWTRNAHFAYSNNSAVFDSRPDMRLFFDFWKTLFESGSGEPGFINEKAAFEHAKKLDRHAEYGNLLVNPCAEIYSFKSTFFCNLTTVNIKPEDTYASIKEKVTLASILGYWQATVTDFRYIRSRWKKNAEDEMLMGVCLSGICDNKLFYTVSDKTKNELEKLRDHSKKIADEWAAKFGTPKTKAWTAIKPSGNSAALAGVSSGIHPAYDKYYIRRVQQNMDDPVSKFLISQGVPHEESTYVPNTVVFEFPMRATKTAVISKELPALEQLKLWLMYKNHYATHTVSCTVYVRDHEWFDVGAWVYENFDELVGISFLPYSDAKYEQAPLESISAEIYAEKVTSFPDINWELFSETHDNTDLTVVKECTGAACDVTI